MDIVHASKVIVIADAQAGVAKALPDQSITQVIDERVAKHSCVPHKKSLAVVSEKLTGGQTWELRYTEAAAGGVAAKVLQLALHKQTMITTLRQLVVQFQNVSVMFSRARRWERETAVIKTIAHGIGIGRGVFREDSAGIRTINVSDIRVRAAVIRKARSSPRAGLGGSRSTALINVGQTGGRQGHDSI